MDQHIKFEDNQLICNRAIDN